MKGNFSVVLLKKKNPIWGSVVDGRFQPEGWRCWVEPRHSLGSTQHSHPSGWKRPSTIEPHIRFLHFESDAEFSEWALFPFISATIQNYHHHRHYPHMPQRHCMLYSANASAQIYGLSAFIQHHLLCLPQLFFC